MVQATEFFDAVKKGNLAAVKEALANDRTLVDAKTETGLSPLTVAAYYGKGAILEAILAYRPSMTLPEAAIVGDLERVKDLVERDRRSVNESSPDGYSALALASHFGRPDVVRYLLARAADVSLAAPESGFTALTGAVAGGHPEIVRELIAAGADVNHRYEEQRFSPLITAAADGDPEIVRLLLAAGADPTARTTDGKTAASIALERNHPEIAELLRKHGAP
jgi:ankyrin repeat protein